MEKINYLAVIGECAYQYKPALESLFQKVIVLPPEKTLPSPVSSHPDMIVSSIGNALFASRDYVTENKKIFTEIERLTGFTLCPSNVKRGNIYPFDVAFNVFQTNGFIYSLTEYTAPEIISEARRQNITARRVKQGYSACSALFADGCVITGDPSIAAAAKDDGFHVTLIDNSVIHLPGYSHGFIGGAGGVCKDTVYLFGNTESIPELSKYKTVALSHNQVTDCGGIKFFPIISSYLR